MKKQHEHSKLIPANQHTKRKHKQCEHNKKTLINSSSDCSTRITVYTTPQCSKCNALKLQLQRLGIPYTEIDITDTEEMTKLIIENTVILTAPTLRIGNTFLTITEMRT